MKPYIILFIVLVIITVGVVFRMKQKKSSMNEKKTKINIPSIQNSDDLNKAAVDLDTADDGTISKELHRLEADVSRL